MPFTKFEFVVAWLYRESICYYLFVKAGINPTVKWRDGKYRLKWGGLAEKVSEPVEKSSIKISSNIEIPQTPVVINKYASNTNLTSTVSVPVTTLSPVKNLQMTHKRTNSYTALMNSTKSNQSLFNSNSDIESSPSQPLLNAYNNQSPSGSPGKPNGSPKTFNQRSHHQHHHSISSPISFQPSLMINSTIIDNSKFTDLKIV